MTTATTLATREINPRIGTEITAEKGTLLSGEHAPTIRGLLAERGVLVFPKIDFTADEQVATARAPAGVGDAAPVRLSARVVGR